MTDPVAADVATAERRPAGDRPAAGPPGRAACAGRPGRPRSAAADTAILDATIDLFAECGFEGVTMEAVAERAGVAKSTVYRRYPSKLDMIMAAWSDCSPDGDEVDVDTGSLELDLRSAAARLRRVFGSDPVGRAVPAALAAAARYPTFAEEHRAFVAARRAPMKAMIERASARGEIRADTDPDLLIDLIAGPIFYRTFCLAEPITDEALDAIVHVAVDGVRAERPRGARTRSAGT